jgi:prepilin-type processing-associated H-X9-DG protein
MHNYHDTYLAFPQGAAHGSWTDNGVSTGHHCTWILASLPYLEQGNLYNQFTLGMFTRAGETPAKTVLPVIHCPTGEFNNGIMEPWTSGRSQYWRQAGLANTNYKGCNGSMWVGNPYARSDISGRFGSTTARDLEFGNGVFPRNNAAKAVSLGRGTIWVKTAIRDVTDGTSSTIAIGEALPEWSDDSCWVDDNGTIAVTAIPMNLYKTAGGVRRPFCQDWQRAYGFASRHTGGAQFMLCDGSVRFISDSINLPTYYALGTISTGEVAGEF